MSLGESRWAAEWAQVAESRSAVAWRLAESGPGSAWVAAWTKAAESRSAEGLAMVEVKVSAAAWPLGEESAPAWRLTVTSS